MLKTKDNPGGTPIEVFDGLRAALARNRAQFYLDFASGPFYGFNRPNAKVSQAVIQNWWRQGMMGGAKPSVHQTFTYRAHVRLVVRMGRDWYSSVSMRPS